MKMNKTITILAFMLVLLSTLAMAEWVKDHNSCTDNYQSQNCAASQKACAWVSSTLYCALPATVNAAIPGSPSTINYNAPSQALGGGYVFNCLRTNTVACNVWECQSDLSCSNVGRKTTCAGGATTFSCDVCRDGYHYCDGSYVDGNGCEIVEGSTPFPSEPNSHYGVDDCVNPICNTNYLDCDGDLGTTGTGCEVLDGSVCYVGPVPGTVTGCSGGAANCVVDPVHHMTGTEAAYSSGNANLWSTQYGSGWLANFTRAYAAPTSNSNITFGINNNGCIVFNDSSSQCTAGVAAGTAGWVDDGSVVRLDNSADKVGIGTSNPVAALHVNITAGGAAAFGGGSTTASENYAFASGYNSRATAEGSVAMGMFPYANGYGSVAISRATSGGAYSVAIGEYAVASNNRAYSFGIGTTASGVYSFAIGNSTTASATSSMAIGNGVTASGIKSIAFGHGIEVSGSESIGVGLDSIHRTVSRNNVMSIMGGNVGIGTTSPNATLHVAGDINVTAGNDICIDGGNCLGTLSAGATFVGKTSGYYDADFTSATPAGFEGYKAANYLCNASFTGAHICTTHEIVYTIANRDLTVISDWSMKAWIAVGPSKYSGIGVKFVNDCHGFTDDGSAGNAFGNWWYFNQTTGGVGETGTCDSALQIACCM
ncbi:MAG: hypothetical protein ABIA62_03390 [Candidatus Woesearchaeota archaeon]